MAKIDSYTSRSSREGTALADDEPLDEFYRPAAASRPRPEARGERPLPRKGNRTADAPGDFAGADDAFLRTRRRVPVRKGLLRYGPVGRIALAVAVVAAIGILGALVFAVRNFFDHDPRFRVDSAASIQTDGNSQLTRPELLAVFGSDIGRNIFFVPLAERRAELEQVPWVEHATVMRILPDQLRVSVVERTPVAFVRLGNKISLVDAHGVVLEMPPAAMAARHYSFPVVTGINPADPLSVRASRMKIYQQFITDLNSGGEKPSTQLSEVDLSDPEDVRAMVPGAQGSDLLLHFGDQDYLIRYQNYQAHLAEWLRQYPHLASVDLRYERQVILQMADGTPSNSGQTANTPQAEKQAAPKPALKPPARHRAADVHKHVKSHALRKIR